MDTTYDVNSLNLLFRNRRSVFTDQFVPGAQAPDEVIREILENATWAPTHKKTEPWYFIVFSGDGRKRLSEFQSNLYRETAGTKFKQEKFEKFRNMPLLSSHVIAICMKRSRQNSVPEIEEIAAVACAVENIYLSVTAFGLGGYWSTGGITYEESAKPFFGLEENDLLMGFFYIGIIRDASPPSVRTDISLKSTWVTE